jgi:hypothetical protein
VCISVDATQRFVGGFTLWAQQAARPILGAGDERWQVHEVQ